MFKRLLTGVVLGAAVGMLVLPQLDRKTQKIIKKTGRKLVGAAEDAYDSVIDMIN